MTRAQAFLGQCFSARSLRQRSGQPSKLRASIRRGLPSRPSVRVKYIALSAHGLQIDWIGRIGLDLAAQPVDLHVDGALAAARRIVAGQFVAGDRRAAPLGEQAQEVALALGELDALVL